MTDNAKPGGKWGVERWLTAGWMTGAAILLLLPLIAMEFTDEVDWTAADFLFAAVLLFGAGGAYEAVARMGNLAYRAATAVAVGIGFLLIWVNGAVGIIGSENDDSNAMYLAVMGVAVIGAVIARFQANGMARSMFAAAGAQAAVAGIAIGFGLGRTPGLPVEQGSGAVELAMINGVFCLLWILAGGLYRRAALGQIFARLAP